jgi:phage tail-like protein
MSVAESTYNRLPLEYLELDKEEVLKTLIYAVAPKLQAAADAIATLGDNFNPDTAPDEWLGWLLEKIGWPVDESFTNYQKREILKLVGTWRKNYGKPGVIEAIIKLSFKPTAANIGLDVTLEARKSIKGGFRIGKGRIGQGRIYKRFSRNNILVTITNFNDVADTANTRLRLERFLDWLIPPFMTFRILN